MRISAVFIPCGVTYHFATIKLHSSPRDAATNDRGRVVTQGDLNMDWLKPFTSARPFVSGDVLFKKGDVADAMYFVVLGRFRLTETSKDILSGQIVGELGLLAPDQLRTQTLQCTESGKMLQITYEQVKQLYYQNPQFGSSASTISVAKIMSDLFMILFLADAAAF